MPSTMETVLINVFGDEFGIGELWDAYELYKNSKQFEGTFLRSIGYIIAGIIIWAGFVLLVLSIIFSIFGEGHTMEYVSIGLIVVGGMLILTLFAYHHYKHHKKVTSAQNV